MSRLAPLLLLPGLLLAALPGLAASHETPVCPPPSLTREDLTALEAADFVVEAPAERDRLALLLPACLEDPDPAIRDGVVFEGLARWLRGGGLSAETLRTLAARLTAALAAADGDAAGFRGPFAALLLSEVARADRLIPEPPPEGVKPILDDAARQALVDQAARYLAGIQDYRGFDPKEGWRHGVAHGADLVLQLGLNPRLGAADVQRLLDALARQVAPPGEVFYTFGEGERLARAVFFIHRRGLPDSAFLDGAWWDRFFAAVGEPGPLPTWGDAYASLPGLARRHNTLAFLHAVAFAGRNAGDDAGNRLAALAEREIVRVMGG